MRVQKHSSVGGGSAYESPETFKCGRWVSIWESRNIQVWEVGQHMRVQKHSSVGGGSSYESSETFKCGRWVSIWKFRYIQVWELGQNLRVQKHSSVGGGSYIWEMQIWGNSSECIAYIYCICITAVLQMYNTCHSLPIFCAAQNSREWKNVHLLTSADMCVCWKTDTSIYHEYWGQLTNINQMCT